MGRQICFYITQEDTNALVEQIYLQGGFILNSNGISLVKEELLSLSDYNYCQEHFKCNKFFIAKPSFSLYYYNDITGQNIDAMRAEVIEFSLCNPSPARIIDTSSVENNFKKEEFIVIDDFDEYQKQMEELMEEPIYIDNPNYIEYGFEHGRLWYTNDFLDNGGKKISKSKELSKLFNSLSKFVKCNFKYTKDKFAYIGTDAYEKYLEGTFIPCSGRNKIIVE